MSDFIESGALTYSVRDNSELIYNAVASQVDGVGGSGGDYQISGAASISPTLADGVVIARAISNYAPVTDTKTGIETEFGIGGWPISQDVVDLDGAGVFSLVSADNLSAGTEYHFLFFWISDYYYNTVFVAQTQGLQDAIDDTDVQGGVTIWPVDDSVVATNGVTISGTTTPATSISFSGSVVAGASAGTVIGIASADRTNGTFSEGTPALSWVTVASDGTLTVTTGQTAPSAGSYNIQLTYDNSGVTGGGTYSDTVSITVTAATAGTARYIAVPSVNSDATGQDLAVNDAKSLLDNLKSDWATTMTSLGLAATGVDPVLEFASGSLGGVTWSGVGPFTDGSNPRVVHLRGQGTYSRTSFYPTSGTNLGRLQLTNCEGIRFWALSAGASSSPNGQVHILSGLDDVHFVRCNLHGDMANSTAALAAKAATPEIVVFSGNDSDDVRFRQCTFIGSNTATVLCANGTTANNVLFEGCMTDQLTGDVFKSGAASPASNWTITDMYTTGVTRDPDGVHGDWLQTQGTGIATDWTIDGVFLKWDQWYGDRLGIAIGMKVFQKAPNATMNNFTIRDFIYAGGAKFRTGGPNGSTSFRYCDYLPNADTVAADNQTTSPWQAKVGGFGGISNIDFCVAISNAGSGDAADTPNGLVDYDPGYVAADNPLYDFSGYAALLENYSAPSGAPATTAPTSAIPRRNYGISGWEPKLGSGMHWDDANPAGAYRFKERIYDASTHDNPWDWGWPTCALMAIRYDPEEGCGGAGANTSGTSFDSDGD